MRLTSVLALLVLMFLVACKESPQKMRARLEREISALEREVELQLLDMRRIHPEYEASVREAAILHKGDPSALDRAIEALTSSALEEKRIGQKVLDHLQEQIATRQERLRALGSGSW